MKKFILLFVMLAIPFTSYSLDIKKYKIKSGILEQKIEGTTNGTQTIYFDDYGIREATYTKTVTKIFGISSTTETITINDKDWSINIDLKEKTGTRMPNKAIKEMIDELTEKDYEKFGERMLEKLEAKKIGNETIAGKNCEVWEIKKLNATSWSYEWVPLKTTATVMGMTTTYTTTNFKENVSIPADKFQVPKGIKITDQEAPANMDELMKMMEKGMQGEEE